MALFDHDHTFFHLWGYAVSYLEFFGMVTGVVAIALSAFANVWNWIIGIVNVLLSLALFYQVQLYPDMFLQVFFLVTNIAGFWRWTHPRKQEEDRKHELKISTLTTWQILIGLLVVATGTWIMGTFASNLHEMLPRIFTLPSAFPYLDSFVTVASILGTFYAINKKLECWLVWLPVDAVATYLYFLRDIWLYAVLYFIFFLIASFALYHWWKEYRSYDVPHVVES